MEKRPTVYVSDGEEANLFNMLDGEEANLLMLLDG